MLQSNTSASTLTADDDITTKPLTIVRLDLTWAHIDYTYTDKTGRTVPCTGMRVRIGLPSVGPEPHELLTGEQRHDLAGKISGLLFDRLRRRSDRDPLSAQQVKEMLDGVIESDFKSAVSQAFGTFQVPWVLGEVAEKAVLLDDDSDDGSDCESFISGTTAVGSIFDEKLGKAGKGTGTGTWETIGESKGARGSILRMFQTCLGGRK